MGHTSGVQAHFRSNLKLLLRTPARFWLLLLALVALALVLGAAVQWATGSVAGWFAAIPAVQVTWGRVVRTRYLQPVWDEQGRE